MKIKYKMADIATSAQIIEWLGNNGYELNKYQEFDNTVAKDKNYTFVVFQRYDKGKFSVWVAEKDIIIESWSTSKPILESLGYIIEKIKEKEKLFF